MKLTGKLYSLVAPEGGGSPEHLFSALHGLLRPPLRRLMEGQPWLSLELGGQGGTVRFYAWIPTGQVIVEDLLRAAYPGIELREAGEDPLSPPPTGAVGVASIGFARSTYLPIQTKFDSEPLAPLLSTLARPQGEERIHVVLLLRPRPNGWQASARSYARRLREGAGSFLAEALLPTPTQHRAVAPHQLAQAKAIEEKASGLGFDAAIRVYTVGRDQIAADEFLRSVAAALRPFEGSNGLSFRRVFRREDFLAQLRARSFPRAGQVIMTPPELASIWHMPEEAPAHLEVIRSPKLPVPQDVPREGRILGVSNYAGRERPVALSIPDSRRHLHILGPTGTGKTTLLVNLALQDLTAGRGVAILDPKGDLVEAVLERLPEEREKDVVLISPDRADYSIGLNPLEWTDPEERDLLAENLLFTLQKIYERFWGPRTADILNSAIRTLIRRPDATFCEIPALLTDSSFRARETAGIDDPIGLGGFWGWYESLSEAARSEAVGPVLNKLRDIILRPRIRRLLCQPRSSLDLAGVIDRRGVLLANLSSGRWGEQTASLIGSLLVGKLWQAVRRRSTVQEDHRADFMLYVDEFQTFMGVAQSFADTLAQARSYRLSLTLANQHLGQLPRDLIQALSSNARSRITFQCGQDDARYLAKEFAPLDAQALQALPRYEMAVRVSVSSETSRTFTARSLPLETPPDPEKALRVVEGSLARYGRRADEIDQAIRRSLEAPEQPAPAGGVGRRQKT